MSGIETLSSSGGWRRAESRREILAGQRTEILSDRQGHCLNAPGRVEEAVGKRRESVGICLGKQAQTLMGKGKKMRTEVAEKQDRDTEEHIKTSREGWRVGQMRGGGGGERRPLAVEPSWWSERGGAGCSGEGLPSPGDTAHITGALTGRVDLLSGVDAMAGAEQCTSIQAAGVPLAGRALEQRSRSVDQRAGLSALSLSPAAVAELGAQRQELPGSGDHLGGGQPTDTDH
ncbi:hypothetical protein FQN60_007651 [Etheostoma spectabile]|uniref:Uncharacterized protein n=1 Tax=Etheostoma spectabile TaxID=54343 RepID=A0A5J5CUK3_9PERO|nr:hypothetical protein FQN60_007651 [Etheostoma spectabile]